MTNPRAAAEWCYCTDSGEALVECEPHKYARQQVEAFREQVIVWLDNEDKNGDPDDLYTGRVHRVAAIRQLLP